MPKLARETRENERERERKREREEVSELDRYEGKGGRTDRRTSELLKENMKERSV